MFLFWLIPLSLFMMQTAIKSILLYTSTRVFCTL